MKKFKYIAFNKPFGVLTQFTGDKNDRTLSEFNLPKDIYAAGRLDKDSEGLLILTDDGIFNQRLTNPSSKKYKTYHVQVEKIPTESSLQELRDGVLIKDYKTKPSQVKILHDYHIEERNPPVRFRKNIPTCWLEIKIIEGKNRQVRRMTAKIGHPTLRLIRYSIGDISIKDILVGEFKHVSKKDILK